MKEAISGKSIFYNLPIFFRKSATKFLFLVFKSPISHISLMINMVDDIMSIID